jgi:hypothetical protein
MDRPKLNITADKLLWTRISDIDVAIVILLWQTKQYCKNLPDTFDIECPSVAMLFVIK